MSERFRRKEPQLQIPTRGDPALDAEARRLQGMVNRTAPVPKGQPAGMPQQEIRETLENVEELGYTMTYEIRESTQLSGRALQRLIRSYDQDYGLEVLDAVDVVIALVILDEEGELLDDSSEQEFRFLQMEDGWYLDVDSMY